MLIPRSNLFPKFRENARWDFSGVTFVTLHLPGSKDGRGRALAAGDRSHRHAGDAAEGVAGHTG